MFSVTPTLFLHPVWPRASAGDDMADLESAYVAMMDAANAAVSAAAAIVADPGFGASVDAAGLKAQQGAVQQWQTQLQSSDFNSFPPDQAAVQRRLVVVQAIQSGANSIIAQDQGYWAQVKSSFGDVIGQLGAAISKVQALSKTAWTTTKVAVKQGAKTAATDLGKGVAIVAAPAVDQTAQKAQQVVADAQARLQQSTQQAIQQAQQAAKQTTTQSLQQLDAFLQQKEGEAKAGLVKIGMYALGGLGAILIVRGIFSLGRRASAMSGLPRRSSCARQRRAMAQARTAKARAKAERRMRAACR